MAQDNAGDGSDKPSDAAGGVTPEMLAEIKKATSTLIRNMLPGLVKQAMTDSVPAMLEQIADQAVKNKPVDGDGKDGDKPAEGGRSLKALETQINELRQQLKTRDEAIEQKEQQRVDALMRGEVREALSGILGADNQHLPLVMDSLYDARKRFVKGEDGQTLVKFKPEYGVEDELLPLGHKDTVKRLSGELKSMIPAKTAALPNRGRNGQPLPANGQGGRGVLDNLFDTVVAQAAASVSSDPTQK